LNTARPPLALCREGVRFKGKPYYASDSLESPP
jgi:predicted nucleic acid-binding Zn ribbon protein